VSGGAPRRVLVIGAGHHGLLCAARLAAHGLDVLVLEAADRSGGAVRSAEGPLPGFVHDTCAGFFPLTAASPAFADLAQRLARHGLEWIDPPIPMVHLLDDGGGTALHGDLAATAASLDTCRPGAGAAWQRVVEGLWPRREALLGAGLHRLPPLRPAAALVAGLGPAGAVELGRMLLASAATLGRQLFGDERAAAWLASSAAHGDLSVHGAGSGAFGFVLNFLGHVVGWPFPRGGAGRLTDALVAELRASGGALRCGARVERIVVRGGRVAGVRLAGGEALAADAVVASVSAGVLGRLLSEDALPGRLTRRLCRWRYGLGTFKLDYALAGPVPWVNEPARGAGVVHVGGPLDEIATAQHEASMGRTPTRPALVVGQHTLHDPSRAPAGRHTLYVYTRLPQHPDVPDDEVVARVEAQFERFAPGFQRLVLARSVRSPAAIERENASLVGGDLAGGSMELDQQLIFRPAPELCRGRTPIGGLYLAGASVHPGPGVHGVSGRAAADALLGDDVRLFRRIVRARTAPRAPRPPDWPVG
jgi:phytoene dehydrogenase-like protein